ncbi:unnamed protein product [Allacma fusca]|uniref:Uncharacterized protein n=1 Tax=Allacma fusca TaxID=39272 RepID=A0A8J2KQ23_9HEXA|nr:unnamed protein product [Allacma fusca]
MDDRPTSSSSMVLGRRTHRGSNSDPEGRDEIFRRHHTIHHTCEHTMSEGERELVSPECSPALSRSSAAGADDSEGKGKTSWKQCSGSLDSILSKDEPKSSPGRRLMLPRFSSFVHKRTRMGFMRRLSPKGSDHQS